MACRRRIDAVDATDALASAMVIISRMSTAEAFPTPFTQPLLPLIQQYLILHSALSPNSDDVTSWHFRSLQNVPIAYTAPQASKKELLYARMFHQ